MLFIVGLVLVPGLKAETNPEILLFQKNTQDIRNKLKEARAKKEIKTGEERVVMPKEGQQESKVSKKGNNLPSHSVRGTSDNFEVAKDIIQAEGPSLVQGMYEGIKNMSGVVVDQVKAHPHMVKGVVGLALTYGVYKTKDKIKTFVKEHPYAIGSLALAAATITGASFYTGLPLLTCITTTKPLMEFGLAAGKVVLYGPLLFSNWFAAATGIGSLVSGGVNMIKHLIAGKEDESKVVSPKDNEDQSKVVKV